MSISVFCEKKIQEIEEKLAKPVLNDAVYDPAELDGMKKAYEEILLLAKKEEERMKEILEGSKIPHPQNVLRYDDYSWNDEIEYLKNKLFLEEGK